MENKIVFGKWEGIFLMLILMNTQIFLNFPRAMTESAGTGSWIMAIYITVLALLVFALISRLYTNFEGKDLLDISEIAGGKPGKIIVGSIFTAYLIYIIAVVLREFGEDMKTITLQNSPLSFVLMFFLAGIIVANYVGLEAIVRLAAIVVPIVMVGFLFIIIGVSPYWKFANLTPLLGTGASDIFIKGSMKISSFSAISLLLLITPYLKTNKNFKAVGYISLCAAGFNFIISCLIYAAVFAYPISMENFLPVYQLARLINYGRFFQRVESIFVLVWAAGALLYLSAGFFFILYIFKKTFGLKYHKPLIIPFAILIFSISLMPPNLMSTVELETEYFRNYIWIVTFAMPIIVLMIAKFRKKVKKGGA